jgi:hypothetical protein
MFGLFDDNRSDYDRGHDAGSRVQSAADEAVHIVGSILHSDEYLAGFNDGEADRVEECDEDDEDDDEEDEDEDD